ncbi:sugar ABC transporter substrate-binding protein [Vibrio hannami]|uniref:sugar ABC transporter substrate-binding protein n=1 Tax=Vibrio hannami TaxID=2717094 RepID=UPI00241006C2|nr:sugar ABC transporter substrate-binding protein [Vibrio hannami]MDG3087596.1 sugar ABC transporter substrate-binding protein [Vibrio hannami]
MNCIKKLFTTTMLLTAGTFSASTIADQMKIGYTTMDLANPYFIAVTNGVKDKAKSMDVKVTIHDAKSDPASQIAAIENFVAQGMDAIVVSPIDAMAVESSVQLAHDNNIPIINAHQAMEGADAKIGLIEFEYGYAVGKLAGEYITKHMGGKADVAILGQPEVSALVERTSGIKQGVLDFAPNAKIAAEQAGYTPEMGARAAETVMQSKPSVRVFVGMNDAGILGVFEALKGMGVNESEFALFGLDATEAAQEKIAGNTMYKGTVDIAPYVTGEMIVDVALKVAKEGPIEEMVKIEMFPLLASE